MKANNTKTWNPIDEGEAYMLINHCIERLPEMKEGFVADCIDEGHITISFESPKYILTLKLEKKNDNHKR